jgi:hypothetical protein
MCRQLRCSDVDTEILKGEGEETSPYRVIRGGHEGICVACSGRRQEVYSDERRHELSRDDGTTFAPFSVRPVRSKR